MAMAMATTELDIVAPASDTAAISPPAAGGALHCRGWFRRMVPRGHYSPVGAAERGPADAAANEGSTERNNKPRRGWLRRLLPREYVQRRRWNSNLGGASWLWRWKRLSALSAGLRSSWATALLDAVAFRVMYVLEAVVLGLALSCFFCCCGCQI